MEADSAIYPHDDELQIVAQSHSRTEREVLQETAPLQLAAGTVRVFVNQPNIAGIEESGPLQIPKNREAVLQVGFKFQVARWSI